MKLKVDVLTINISKNLNWYPQSTNVQSKKSDNLEGERNEVRIEVNL